ASDWSSDVCSSDLHTVQAGFFVGELAFMNDEPGFVGAREDLRNDLIERDDLGPNARRKQPQCKIRRGQRARDSDSLLLDLALSEGAGGDDHRPVTVAYASTTGQQCVLVLNVGVRVKRNRRNVVNALH